MRGAIDGVDLSSGNNRLVAEHITVGSFHMLELERNKEFTVETKLWGARVVKILEEGGNFGYDQSKIAVEIRVKEFMEMVSSVLRTQRS